MRPVALFDLDHTLTRKDTFVGFWFALLRLRPWRALFCLHLPVALVLCRMNLLPNARLKSLFLASVGAGLDRRRVDAACLSYARSVVSRDLRARALAKLQEARENGATIMLATASLDIYVLPIARLLAIDEAFVVCTQAAFEDDCLTGALDGPNCYGEAKAKAIAERLHALGAGPVLSAYSDHPSDRPMLALAERPVAVNPSPELRRHAQFVKIDIEDWDIAA